MIVNVHSTPNGKLFAICDSDILGEVFEEGGRQLNLSSRFYQGKEMSEQDLERVLKDSYVINAVGKKSVALLIRLKMVDKKNVLKVSGVPYAQCVLGRV
ncbi:DUF424 family protein [Candidatus Woesearchaeota archaeon]|nr:DUF424 family protein [Candidatus Woesearchaeota archaeon]